MTSISQSARDYEAYWQEMSGSFKFFPSTRYRVSLIQEELTKLKFKNVLDIGCGDGSLLASIKARFPQAALFGCDVSSMAVQDCRRRYPDDTFFSFDLSKDEPNQIKNSYDLVICSEVIEHLDDYRLALNNLFALVAPGGTVILTTPTGKIWKSYRYHGHVRHFDLNELSDDLASAGFSGISGFAYGWPFMVLQNQIADWIFPFVKKNFIEVPRYGFFKRLIAEFVYRLFLLNSKKRGCALLLRAKRET